MPTAYLRHAEGSAFEPETGRLLRLGPVSVVPTPTWMRWRPDELYDALRQPGLARARAHLDTMLGWAVEAGADEHAEVIRERIRELDEDPLYVAPDRRLPRPAHPPDTNTRWSFGPPLEERLAEVAAQPRTPVDHGMPQLYAVTLAGLHRLAVATKVTRYRTDELRQMLAAAGEAFARPNEFPPQPDPADVEAFLAVLQAEEYATRGPGGWVLNLDSLPF
jgi:hypothetical protein